LGLCLLLAAGCETASPQSSNVTGEYLAGRFAARANAIDQAAEAFAGAHADAPQQVVILKDAFFFHLAAGDIDKATPYAQDILAVAPDADDGLARVALAANALKYGRLKQARSFLSGDMDAPFIKSVAFLTDVWIEQGLDGPAAALAKLTSPPAGVFDGFNPLHVALLSEQAGKTEEARAAYQSAVFGLGGPVGRSAYGAFLERVGDAQAAREYYALLGSESGAGRRIAEEGLARLESGRATDAFAKTTTNEGAAIAFYSFAGALIEQAADQRARASDAGFMVGEPRFNLPLALVRIALYLDPKLDESRRLVGTILNIYGEYEAAEAVLAEIPASSPHYEQARIEMAGGLAARDKPDDAAGLLKDAIRRDPEGAELKWTLANLYAGAGEHRQAVDVLDGVIGNLPEKPAEDSWRYYVSRGGSLLELNQWERAEADLKRAVEIAPEEPTALNYLGYSWAERGVNLEEAFKLIEKAVAAQPQSGAIVDSLGWAHYQLGDYEEAVGHLEQAAMLEPSDPTITDHLGDVYWRLNRKVEARYQWERALELDPNEGQKAALEKKLKVGLEDEKPSRNDI
jgi:tetratricopeptide (TPR) repeat protein